MRREDVTGREEPRDLPQVSEEPWDGSNPDDAGRRDDDWSASGTEDPAFFIKPSEGDQ